MVPVAAVVAVPPSKTRRVGMAAIVVFVAKEEEEEEGRCGGFGRSNAVAVAAGVVLVVFVGMEDPGIASEEFDGSIEKRAQSERRKKKYSDKR